MSIAQTLSNQNVYGVTYAIVDSSGIHFESELAIQLGDGGLTTLRMPTQLSERQAIQQLVCGRQVC
ncbi:hypothetical protein DBR00_12270 [Pseudomonas sp. HMWF032]|uniref:type III secretion system co-regulatory protein PtrC n=1 Tax=unclassified Pseudomonas TaxID=196821 RepID=UPI000D39E2D8|nr:MULTISPECIES: type III secretion system co-regulatory protein PtrC [unclassified Pseudomonas]PTS84134.1 hypothetical protein DBR00_12270 [Pseudomonas sp. HMWF032]PTT78823.1 hypothetical protein DBR41_22745 [Pseudomonas sp. HMWF010]WAC43857.1 hypothetical protein OU997_16630 [Pseudomonas sp. SL4(2022)]